MCNCCTDGGSGADADVTIYEARSSSIDLQNVRGFGAVASYGHYPTTPYFLKAYFTYWTEKPLEKIHMHNVEYDLGTESQQNAPVKMSPTIVENLSNIEQAVTRTVKYSVSEESTFTFE